jgi:hypothetical protein
MGFIKRFLTTEVYKKNPSRFKPPRCPKLDFRWKCEEKLLPQDFYGTFFWTAAIIGESTIDISEWIWHVYLKH